MKRALLDDHLLRDVLADDIGEGLASVLVDRAPATTNLYVYRLTRSVLTAPGGALTGSWGADARRELARRLLALPAEIEVVPMRLLVHQMAEIAGEHRVSTLGAEAVAASAHLGAPLLVWEGDDGPGIRAASAARGAGYETLGR